MAKVSEKYELLYLINSALGEEKIAEIVEKFRSLIEANGTLEETDVWGNRQLAYPINDLTEGYYVLVRFESKPEFPAELDRVLKITEGVLRSMITIKP